MLTISAIEKKHIASKDRIGQVFGDYTVIGVSTYKDSSHSYYLIVRCSCGTVREVAKQNLIQKKTCSCGHVRRREEGLGSAHNLYGAYRYNTKRRSKDLEFNLTFEQFLEITSSNCYFCDAVPSKIHFPTRMNGAYVYNGIDRLDSNRDYEYDNCVPCCWDCNRAKGELSVEEFKSWIRRVYDKTISDEDKNV